MKKILIIAALLIFGASARSANLSYVCYLDSIHYAGTDSLAFKIVLKNTGADTMAIQSFSIQLNWNYAGIGNQGTVRFRYITGTASTSLPTVQRTPTVSINSSMQLLINYPVATYSQSYKIVTGNSISLGWFKITNSVDYNQTEPTGIEWVFPKTTLQVYINRITSPSNVTLIADFYTYNPGSSGGTGGSITCGDSASSCVSNGVLYVDGSGNIATDNFHSMDGTDYINRTGGIYNYGLLDTSYLEASQLRFDHYPMASILGYGLQLLDITTIPSRYTVYDNGAIGVTNGDLMISADSTTINGNLWVNGKITAIGGVDPPYVSYKKETHAAIILLSQKVTDDVMQFWCAKDNRMEIYSLKEKKFYTFDGKSVN